jgi:hypothetical protein
MDDNKYIYLEVGKYTIQVKMEHEGVVVDAFLTNEIDSEDVMSIATTYKFYDELGMEVTHVKEEI